MPGIKTCTDWELIDLIKLGDEQSFAEVFNRYQSLLFNFAYDLRAFYFILRLLKGLSFDFVTVEVQLPLISYYPGQILNPSQLLRQYRCALLLPCYLLDTSTIQQ